MTPEEFRVAGHRLVDWIADFRRSVADLPVESTAAPGDVRRAMAPAPPVDAVDFDELLEEMARVVLPGMTHFQHPRFFGFFPGNADLSSVLADMTSTGLGALGISWQSNPALTEVEEVVGDWMRRLCGMSDRWRGTIHDTSSTSVLVALLCARERASGHSQRSGGIAGWDRPLVVYATAQSHSSVVKAAALAGYGLDHLRLVGTDVHTRAMDPAALAAAMDADRADGLQPAAVVATVGSTGVTACDPLDAIGPVAARHGAWLHVDAAMAGAVMLLPERRELFDGLDHADSLSWNPHKWLGAAMDCTLFYVADPDLLVEVMSTSPSYLRGDTDGQVTQYRDWGIPLGRRFRALKLWYLLALHGVPAIQARLRRDLDHAAWLAGQVAVTPEWEVVAPVPLQTVCVRHQPEGLDGQELDRHTLDWARRVNAGGGAYLTPAVLEGRWMVRVSMGSLDTTREDVAAVWQLMQDAATA